MSPSMIFDELATDITPRTLPDVSDSPAMSSQIIFTQKGGITAPSRLFQKYKRIKTAASTFNCVKPSREIKHKFRTAGPRRKKKFVIKLPCRGPLQRADMRMPLRLLALIWMPIGAVLFGGGMFAGWLVWRR